VEAGRTGSAPVRKGVGGDAVSGGGELAGAAWRVRVCGGGGRGEGFTQWVPFLSVSSTLTPHPSLSSSPSRFLIMFHTHIQGLSPSPSLSATSSDEWTLVPCSR
jgi:hypothetical protein